MHVCVYVCVCVCVTVTACVHVCVGGKHPFGENYERDTNILRGQPNMAPLVHQPEALNLLQAMLHKDPGSRPVMPAVLAHPMWWSPDSLLQLLVDVSDRWGGAIPAWAILYIYIYRIE